MSAMLLNIGKAKRNEDIVEDFDVEVSLDDDLVIDRGYHFLSPARVTGSFYYKGSILFLDARVTYTLSCVCDNCGEEIEREFSFDMSEEFVEEYASHDPDDYLINQIAIDLDRPVCDNLLYNLPSRILCKENCQGLCDICGKNKNTYSCNCEAIESEERHREQNPFNKIKIIGDN